MGLPESIKAAGALANPSFYDKAYVCTVLSMNADGSYNVVPKDTAIPPLSSIPYVGGGTSKVLAQGIECLAVFDATGAAWLVGIRGSLNGADWVPLGTALVTFLGDLLKAITGHVHMADGGGPASFVPPLPGTTGLLSTTVKVEP